MYNGISFKLPKALRALGLGLLLTGSSLFQLSPMQAGTAKAQLIDEVPPTGVQCWDFNRRQKRFGPVNLSVSVKAATISDLTSLNLSGLKDAFSADLIYNFSILHAGARIHSIHVSPNHITSGFAGGRATIQPDGKSANGIIHGGSRLDAGAAIVANIAKQSGNSTTGYPSLGEILDLAEYLGAAVEQSQVLQILGHAVSPGSAALNASQVEDLSRTQGYDIAKKYMTVCTISGAQYTGPDESAAIQQVASAVEAANQEALRFNQLAPGQDGVYCLSGGFSCVKTSPTFGTLEWKGPMEQVTAPVSTCQNCSTGHIVTAAGPVTINVSSNIGNSSTGSSSSSSGSSGSCSGCSTGHTTTANEEKYCWGGCKP